MKVNIHHILLLTIALGFAACKKDNFEEPSSKLTGRVLYNNEEIGLQYNEVPLELYQPGFGKTGAINATFAQDGSYSALLFNGNYKLIIPGSNGPFRWRQNASGGRDTLNVAVNGAQTLDLQVEPYYMVRNATFTATGMTLAATFRVDQIITGADAKAIDQVVVYVNKTQFVSGADNIASTSIAGADITNPASMSLSVTIPAMTPAQNYVFARVGVRISGVEDMIFSPLQKIQL
ncbi:hypothetical protein PBAL39_12718 [Pedobacter sp. BAL39]|uniref:DUF3823 domain-containing protein n=1 Tax=Pedobacter sp. BAL39 TaxID=391596 RepID=UPI000155A4B7|nr:DUF3823 domain-containing protein [Pedobacter sp. BAL39]EDM34330.1 hypothetical protein PBAL39_12718 [Pedobacter sp. BAL39]